jgi:hypothetical protein
MGPRVTGVLTGLETGTNTDKASARDVPHAAGAVHSGATGYVDVERGLSQQHDGIFVEKVMNGKQHPFLNKSNAFLHRENGYAHGLFGASTAEFEAEFVFLKET